MRILTAALVGAFVVGCASKLPSIDDPLKPQKGRLWDLKANSLTGVPVDLAKYDGKLALVVNVASECGFTPQYKGLQMLWSSYEKRGFVVLGFPSNQFFSQEPGTAAQIARFCELNYGVSFPMFQKADVKGDDQQPVYRFLTQAHDEPSWNFNKYLVGPSGKVIAHFGSKTTPEDLVPLIEKHLPN